MTPTPKRPSGSHEIAQSQSELLVELITLMQEERKKPRSIDWIKSASSLIAMLAVIVGAILFVGSLTNRVSAVENNQSQVQNQYVTKDAFNGLSSQINGMEQRQIDMDKKLDAYILSQRNK